MNIVMDDKERIEYIIKDKGLSNVEFSSITGIAPATISHISSGRSRPTLAILKGILSGFPDLNPEWVFMGTGPMYKDNNDSLPAQTDGQVSASGSYDLFSSIEQMESEKHGASHKPAKLQASKPTSVAADEIKDVIRESFETMMGRQRRKIVEVRIFFDDGTYEAFSTPKEK
ncbi:MAG: helix-turn-helix transcriptional regulator [Bacteroidaceae bacterium]|nr:helix-turn-helix transcriptional regulator [Bacteroidaceae bacterium]